MTKENLEKIICSGNAVHSQDVTPEEKKTIISLLGVYGLPSSTCYSRLFRIGFSQWEIIGIDELRSRFLAKYADELKAIEYRKDDTAYSRIVNDNGMTSGLFYDQIKTAKLTNRYKSFMKEHGMCEMSCYKRSLADNWKLWEKTGIRNILKDISLG